MTTTASTSGRLSRQILFQLIIFGAMIVACGTVISYYLMYNHTKDKALGYLKQYMLERTEHENETFDEAHMMLSMFRDEFLKMYLSDVEYTEEDFWNLYFVDEHGATRMKRKFFDESMDPVIGRTYGVSSFIGNNQPVDSPDLQRRLLISYTLVNRYGPSWYHVGGLHVTYPENAITIYYPESPWGLEAKPDLPMNELGVIKATLQSENPEREPVWTGLYFDETAEYWTITYEMPVDYQGRHLMNPSMDLKLKAIMDRLINEHPKGAYNFLIRDDGFLVAHPGEELTESKKWQGLLSLDKIENQDIVRMHHLINESVSKPFKPLYVLDDEEGGNYLLTARLSGPDWWFITVYPKALITAEAHKASRIVLVLGLSIFLLYYIITYFIIHKQVRNPLQMLQTAVAKVAEGNYNDVAEHPERLPMDQKNEIGRLAGSFLDMSVHVRDVNLHLERIVENRTKELEEANARLRDMSLLDGLTGIHNRRSFDRDIALVFDEAKSGTESFSLMMTDVDFFKNYNDTHGHIAGDEVLRTIADLIAENIRKEDRVYRYGGEELVVIFSNITKDSALQIGERILQAVQERNIEHADSPHNVVTISAGLVEYNAAYQSPTEMIQAADRKLYEAKTGGRNAIKV